MELGEVVLRVLPVALRKTVKANPTKREPISLPDCDLVGPEEDGSATLDKFESQLWRNRNKGIEPSGIVASTVLIVRLDFPRLPRGTLVDFVTALAPDPPAAAGRPTPSFV